MLPTPRSTLFPYTTLFRSQTSAMLRRLAVSILSSDTSIKDSIRGKRYRACLSTDVLERFLLGFARNRSEEHTSELQSRLHLVCRLLLEKKKKKELVIPPVN